MIKMTDIVDALEDARKVAEQVFKGEYNYSYETELLAIQNVLLAAHFSNENGTNFIADLAKSAMELEQAASQNPKEKQKSTTLVRD